MFENLFLLPHFDGSSPEIARRLYARVDHFEPDAVVLEAVGADFIDDLPDIAGVGAWAEFSARAPIFALYDTRMPPPPAPDDIWPDRWLDPWYEISIRPSGESLLFFNLFRKPQTISIETARLATSETARKLDKIFDLEPLQRQEEEIQAVLDRVTGVIDWIGVYDIGQGSANGLCDSGETPLAYFDLGGGVTANLGTFPSALNDFCYQASPPVVLSHWDWDHWSSGAKFQGAQGLYWITPVQSLGAVHSTFAAGLHSAGKLFVWPSALARLSSGQMTIHKCTSTGANRNHTGLAMEVQGPSGEPPILLTGDARYTAIPGAVGATFTSLVAPHHGANMSSHATPAASNLPGARTAYSFGQGNSHHHPTKTAFQDHSAAGWPQSALGENAPVDRNTTNRSVGGLGHLGLGWRSAPSLPGHSCTSPGCSVELRHT